MERERERAEVIEREKRERERERERKRRQKAFHKNKTEKANQKYRYYKENYRFVEICCANLKGKSFVASYSNT